VDIWEEDVFVRSYDVDLHGKVFLDVLLSFMQDAASNHVDSLGVGYAHLLEMGRFWVLSRISMIIERYPAWGDGLRIRTWHAGEDRLFGLREFRIHDSKGETVASAASAWLMLDTGSRRPSRPSELYNRLSIPLGHSRSTERLEKLPGVASMDREARHRVQYSDLDVNDHANNARYLEWVLNSYGREHILDHEVSRCEMNFLAECGYGDEIGIRTERTAPTSYVHALRKREEDVEVCRVRLTWRGITAQL
jgi:acyl-ACP thioesterase